MAQKNKDKIEIFYLPSYSPELNPDEYFNGTLKRTLERQGDSANLKQLKSNVHKAAKSIQRNKELVADLYKAKKIAYAS